MKGTQTAVLFMLAAGFLANTLVLLQQQDSHVSHHLQLHWDSRPAGLGWPDTSAYAQAQAAPNAVNKPVGPAAETQDDFRLDAGLWLKYAAADAASEGTQVSGRCKDTHGEDFVHRFRSSCNNACGADVAKPPQQSGSQVDCCVYPVDGGRGLACRARNLVVNATSFMGSRPPSGESRHESYLPQGNPGSVQLQCRRPHSPRQTDALGSAADKRPGITDRQLQSEQLPWFKSAVQQVEPAVLQARCSSSGGEVISHPVMFVSRLDPTNPYHHTQSLVQVFLTLAVHNSSKQLPGLQVILADHFILGPFLGIWQRLGHPYPVLTLDDPTLANRRVCFHDSIHAHYVGPARAFLGYEGIGGSRVCPSTVLMAASHWLRYLFREVLPAAEQPDYDAHNLQAAISGWTTGLLPTPTRVAGSNRSAESSSASRGTDNSSRNDSSSNSGQALSLSSRRLEQTSTQSLTKAQLHRRLNVVWLSRSWFGRAMKAGGGLTGWQASRDMSRDTEDAIVKALELAVLDWNNAACTPAVFGWWQKPHRVPPPTGCKPTQVSFNFRVVELSVEDLHPDQVVLLTRTAVLVGIHGAALTNQMWMRPHRGAVVEFGAGGNFHYHNMAAELGHKHFRLDAPDVDALTKAVHQAMDHVSSRYR